MADPEGDADAEAPRADPGLRQIDQVVVGEEREDREQQVPVAGMARIGRRDADAEQQHVGGGEDQADTPDDLGAVGRRRIAQQRRRRQCPRQAGTGAFERALARLHRVGLEARDRLVAVGRVLLVALALAQDQEASFGIVLDRARLGRRHRLDIAARGDDQDVAAARRLARPAFEEEGALAVGGGLELARGDAREVGAALELVLQQCTALVLPWPDEEREHGDDEQHRPAGAQHRPDEASQRNAAREPDRHFAAAVHARQRRDDGDEERQREQRREMAEADVGEQQQDVLRRDPAERGLAEVPDEHDGQHDRQDHDQRAAEVARELSAQCRIE